MKLTSSTDSEIILKLSDISEQKGVSLRLSDKQIYIQLIHLCEEKGTYDEELKLYFVQYSINNFMKLFSKSSHTVQRGLNLLSECEVISRIEVENSFKKLPGNKVTINMPYKTYLLTIF